MAEQHDTKSENLACQSLVCYLFNLTNQVNGILMVSFVLFSPFACVFCDRYNFQMIYAVMNTVQLTKYLHVLCVKPSNKGHKLKILMVGHPATSSLQPTLEGL